MTLKIYALTGVACLLSIFIGCSGAPNDLPDLAPVSGTVTLDGSALPDANVVFFPAKGPAASGKTDAQGNYKLTTQTPDDGAAVGSHKVTVTASTSAEIPPAGADPNESLESLAKIPTKYADVNTTDLTATVEAGKENVVPLELKSK